MNTTYSWTAYHRDGSGVSQYVDSSETPYSVINQDELSYFVLDSDNPSMPYFMVNVQEGFITLNDTPIMFGVFNTNRLIYFRRVRQMLGVGHDNVSTKVLHILGLQATIDGKNKKIMFSVDDKTGEVSVFNG